MMCKRKYMSVCLCMWEVRRTQWCSSVVCSQFPVLGLVNLLLYPQSKQLSCISGMTHISPLAFTLCPRVLIIADLLKGSKSGAKTPTPTLPFLPPDSYFLPCHCRKQRWAQEKSNPPSCGEEYSLLSHLDSILFPLDVIFLSYCFAIKQ